jgi:hypothetical protein
MTRELCQMARDDGLRGATVSIDDFYLNRQEQTELAKKHRDNPYLQHRGFPGTHDILLGTRVLRELKSIAQYHSPSVVRSVGLRRNWRPPPATRVACRQTAVGFRVSGGLDAGVSAR